MIIITWCFICLKFQYFDIYSNYLQKIVNIYLPFFANAIDVKMQYCMSS